MTTTTSEQGGNAEPRPIIPALAPFYNFAREISYPLIRVTVGGTPKRVNVCTSCIKAGKISR